MKPRTVKKGPVTGRLVREQVRAAVENAHAGRVVALRWDANTEHAVRALYEPLLLHHLPNIAPPWLGELLVGYNEEGSESTLTIRSCPEYRWSRLTVCPAALNHSVREREAHLVHELFHLPLEGLHHEHAAVKGFVPEEVMGYVDEQWRRAWEGAVCDLTASYLRRNALHA